MERKARKRKERKEKPNMERTNNIVLISGEGGVPSDNILLFFFSIFLFCFSFVLFDGFLLVCFPPFLGSDIWMDYICYSEFFMIRRGDPV